MADAPVYPETGLPMVRGMRPLVVPYKGMQQEIEMPGWYCDQSGESIHTREDMKVSDFALVTLRAKFENLVTPQEVRAIRLTLGLSQVEAGRVIGGGPRAFQKYESGEILASRAMTNLLRTLERHPEDLPRLRSDAQNAQENASERELV